ncbi:MAG: hypothetical protein WCG47_32355 [Dermatophilaceae bacterium]
MGVRDWFRRRQAGPTGPVDGPGMVVDLPAVRAHFEHFVKTRRGVEAYIEPATNVSAHSVVLVATDGEWTRRAVGTRKAGFDMAQSLGIPAYDVLLVGYPSRMREWSSRRRREQGGS